MNRIAKSALVLPLLLVSLALAAGLLVPGLSTHWALVPLLVSAVFLGLPHEAADLSLLHHLQSKQKRRRLVPPVLLYFAAITFTAILAFLLPKFTLILLVLASAWHFGITDAHELHERFKIKAGFRQLVPMGVLRGLLLILTPLTFQSAGVHAIASNWSELLGSTWGATPQAASQVLVTAFPLGFTLGACVCLPMRSPWIDHGRFTTQWIVETFLLFAFFALLPPLFALGVYFLGWHSLRHFLDMKSLSQHRFSLLKLHRLAMPLLVPALGALLVGVLLTQSQNSPERIAVLLLMIIAIVTPAHQWITEKEMHPHTP